MIAIATLAASLIGSYGTIEVLRYRDGWRNTFGTKVLAKIFG